MSKFINTQYKDTINSLVDGFKKRLENPYYIFTDKKATIVTYYNQNTSKSTLDEGSQTEFEPIGEKSPIRYNKILDAYLYGIDRIITNIDISEHGIESDPIEGEAVVLPNTFVPMGQDYFIINYIDTKNTKLLFKVTSISSDTVENGANFYKIGYRLSTIDLKSIDQIEKQVTETYRMVINNLGTNFNSVIRNSDYEYIEIFETISDRLKEYYRSLFFKDKVQSFIYLIGEKHFYDPCMVEFLSKNKVLDTDNDFIYVSHQTILPQTFYLDYDKTFFRSIETKDISNLTGYIGYGKLIEDKYTLFYHRPEDYFLVQYYNDIGPYTYPIETFDSELINRIKNNSPYLPDSEVSYLNIIIRYFNNTKIDGTIVDILKNTKFLPTKEMYYAIPIIIFILEYSIKELMLKKS